MPNFSRNVLPKTKCNGPVIVLTTKNSSGTGSSHVIIEKKVNAKLNRIVWVQYIGRNTGDERSFNHCCKIDVSTDGGQTYETVYDKSVNAFSGVTYADSFNPNGIKYTDIKIEFWNATVYTCSGCVVVYGED